ncbi:serine/threonine protein kinase [Paraliomyxa miuraensis]|uniref:serine/threonine protein kinase n=1 Tax=Paraliomyxa miuraensis TaxID=376150 RepID=UPI002255C680|nr:serine/threonine-protein kinase [Paraliomyxa miuraensis]MCX4243875.1 serine/threonine protein kinase [Paraliomyxa miuraensis]
MHQLGGFIIRSELGRGGMATVYLAEESLSRRLVALKVLHRELTRSEEARRRFISEMQILTSLEHPNVVRCHHCNDVDGQLMMALEFVKGGTLRALLKARGRLTALETCRIASGVLAALDAAHTNAPPIIHRDLKPENILLGDDGVIKVADFGIAKMLGSETLTTTPHGTLHYMSPEQFEGLPTTASTDLYSLGIVLYEMLVGRRPFLGNAPLEIIRAHHSQEPPPFPEAIAREVPPALAQLVFQLLRKDPSTRPPNARVVLDYVARIGQPAPTSRVPAAPGAAHPPQSAWSGPPVRETIDTVQLIEQFADRRGSGKTGRTVLAVSVGVLALVGVGVLAATLGPGLLEHATGPDEPARSAAQQVAPSTASTKEQPRVTSSTEKPLPPPPGSPRSLVSDFLAARDPGGPVPVHPELQRTDFTVKVMVRTDLLEAQRGARIVADSVVNGFTPKVQIVRRPREGRMEHWVLVGRYTTKSAAMGAKASLRPLLNQGANHIDLSTKCAELGPVVEGGVRDCIPP